MPGYPVGFWIILDQVSNEEFQEGRDFLGLFKPSTFPFPAGEEQSYKRDAVQLELGLQVFGLV